MNPQSSQPGPDTAPSAPAGPPGERFDFLTPPQAPGELGRLGSYRVLKVLGQGSMGVVFQAEDTRLRRLVALKVLRPERATTDAARERFLREAQAIAALDHDHIVPVYQLQDEGDLLYLAMPVLKGETLYERLRRQSKLMPAWLPLRQVLQIGWEVAEGLAAAHDKGLIHRDIKPANIWLEARPGQATPRVKILDFGIVHVVGAERLTPSQAIVGTLAYMAPEQARGERVDYRCDLFSLGCVIYRMATGQLPFPGSNVVALVHALKNEEPTPMQRHNPALPLALTVVVRQLMAKDRERRPESAKTVATALRAIAEAEQP